jgi:acyl dehydratase
MRTFEEYVEGSSERFGHYRITWEEVLEFASKYDPQPFHLDDEAARGNPIFGKLAASGLHTAAIAMRMLVDHDAVAGTGRLGSPGLEELSWLKPVYPGDELSLEVEVIGKSAPKSRPDIGFVKMRMTVFNQDDQPVLRQIATFIQPRRVNS